MDPNYKKLRYVRYADDFLIGVIGSKEEAKTTMRAVEDFLTTVLKLQISTDKSGIRKASKGVRFLGYTVRTWTGTDRKVVMAIKDGHKGLKRSVSDRIQLSVPRDKLQSFVKRQGYGQYDTTRAAHRNALVHCDDVEIATIYNSELRGLAQYYALAHDVKRKLNKLELIWKASLYKTLAAKHRTSVTKIVRRFKSSPTQYVVWQQVGGKRVEVQVWRLAELKCKPASFGEVDARHNTAAVRFTKTRMVDRVTADECSACETTRGPFHIHHVNPMRNTKGMPAYRRVVSGRNRKTVALCIECHGLLHRGRLSDKRAG